MAFELPTSKSGPDRACEDTPGSSEGAIGWTSPRKAWARVGSRCYVGFRRHVAMVLAHSFSAFFALSGPGWADPVWTILHARYFGGWDSICDARVDQVPSQKRCYLRSVTRLEPDPNRQRSALIVFVVVGKDHPAVQIVAPIGGTVLGWRRVGVGEDAVTKKLTCGDGRACDLDEASSSQFVKAADDLDWLDLCFDLAGTIECQAVSLSGFPAALKDASLAFMLGPQVGIGRELRVVPSHGLDQQ